MEDGLRRAAAGETELAAGDGDAELSERGGVVVEMAPGAVTGAGPPPAVVGSTLPPRLGDADNPSAHEGFVDAVAAAYGAGLPIAFEGLFAGEIRPRIALPGYPFQRRRHWFPTPTRKPDKTKGAPSQRLVSTTWSRLRPFANSRIAAAHASGFSNCPASPGRPGGRTAPEPHAFRERRTGVRPTSRARRSARRPPRGRRGPRRAGRRGSPPDRSARR